MAAEPVDIRMARLEGAYEQINERLSDLRGEILALRAEVRGEFGGMRSEVRGEFGGMRSEMGGLRSEQAGIASGLRSEIADLRKQMTAQFYWLLTLVLGSILIPLLRDLNR